MTVNTPNQPSSPKRRWLLKSALALGAVGAALGGAVFWNRGVVNGVLTDSGKDVLRAVAHAVLANMLPTDPAAREAKLDAQMIRLNEVIQTMSPSSQGELAALLGLLVNAPTRLMVTGLSSSWAKASTEEVAEALEHMRIHTLPTTMLSYHAVRDLTCIAFFTNPDNWALTGYPGPLEI